MKIILAGRIGFCFGVKRAVRMAESALRKDKQISSLGSIIHNRQVVHELSDRGLKAVKDIDDLKEGMVVISSHGAGPETARAIKAKGLGIIDTTCPFVRKAQDIARRLGKEGYTIVIAGDSDHPEVRALVDTSTSSISTPRGSRGVDTAPNEVFVVKDKKMAGSLGIKDGRRVSVISQTTQSMDNFMEVVKEISGYAPRELRIFNTICSDAQIRQDEARRLAKKVDLMLVVGGRDSANTRRLFEVCKALLSDSYLIETEEDIKKSWLKGVERVGIASGASTPDWVIKRVVKKIAQNAGQKVKNKIQGKGKCKQNG